MIIHLLQSSGNGSGSVGRRDSEGARRRPRLPKRRKSELHGIFEEGLKDKAMSVSMVIRILTITMSPRKKSEKFCMFDCMEEEIVCITVFVRYP